MREAMVEHLDNPTPFTLEGIDAGLGPSSSPEITVFVQPRQAEYLQYVFEGGSRSDVVVPSKDAPVDRHGNLPRGYLRAVEASGGFWMVSDSGVPTLVADDGRGGIEAVAFRVARTEYEKQMDFEGEVALLVDDLLPEATAKAISKAIGD